MMTNEDPSVVLEDAPKSRPRLMSCVYSATLFSASMLVSSVIYALFVVYFVPTEVLENEQWSVFLAFEHLGIIMMVSVIIMPFVVLFQLITGVCLAKKRFLIECIAFLLSVLFCTLFFWPGIFI
jgi:hypothetical protein